MQANRQGTPQHVSCLAVTPENAIPTDPNLVYDTPRADPPCAQKKAHTGLLYAHKAGLCAPSPGYKYWQSLGWRSIIIQAMSIRLMEGGLAMDAGQSCIAGPSVCFP